MRILYLTPGCFDKGGISRYCRYQITALREIVGGERVDVYSVLGPDAHSLEGAFDVVWSAGALTRRKKAEFVARVALAALRHRYDAVIAAHVNLSGLSAAIARGINATTILNVYGMEVWSGFRRDSEWGLRTVDHLISDCHFTARYVESEGLRARGTTSVVWDCVDTQRFAPGIPSADVLKKYGVPDPAIHINLMTLGRMGDDSAHKGFERLLEVFARVAPQVPDLRLVYAGGGRLVGVLRDRATRAGLGDRVAFTGMIHEADLADVYRAAHMFSLVSDRGPYRGEGIPLTPLEAASCGAPILVGNQDGSQEAVVNRENGYVLDPFDLGEHARVVVELARSKKLRSRMGASARHRILELFTYEAFRERHRELLSQWLSGSRLAEERTTAVR